MYKEVWLTVEVCSSIISHCRSPNSSGLSLWYLKYWWKFQESVIFAGRAGHGANDESCIVLLWSKCTCIVHVLWHCMLVEKMTNLCLGVAEMLSLFWCAILRFPPQETSMLFPFTSYLEGSWFERYIQAFHINIFPLRNCQAAGFPSYRQKPTWSFMQCRNG